MWKWPISLHGFFFEKVKTIYCLFLRTTVLGTRKSVNKFLPGNLKQICYVFKHKFNELNPSDSYWGQLLFILGFYGWHSCSSPTSWPFSSRARGSILFFHSFVVQYGHLTSFGLWNVKGSDSCHVGREYSKSNDVIHHTPFSQPMWKHREGDFPSLGPWVEMSSSNVPREHWWARSLSV